MPHTLLIDVRSPAEYSTGYLSLPPPCLPTTNIEYTHIAELPSIYASTHNVAVQKSDRIILYCRSGRRSGIALEALREMGFEDVSDLGGFEVAREWVEGEGKAEFTGGLGFVEMEKPKKGEEERRREREKDVKRLLEGLKGLE